MLSGFAANPEGACYAVWLIWAASWFLAASWSSRAENRPGGFREVPYRIVTVAGFVLLFAFYAPPYRGPFRLWELPEPAAWAMVGLCAAGFLCAWWARIHLGRLWSGWVTKKPEHRVVDTGPYAIVRHPIYTGLLLATFALTVVKGTVFAIVGAVLIAAGFWIKARLEEGFLREQLGADAYDAYRRRVPMLVPFAPKSA